MVLVGVAQPHEQQVSIRGMALGVFLEPTQQNVISDMTFPKVVGEANCN